MNRRQFSICALLTSISSIVGIKTSKSSENLPIVKIENGLVTNLKELLGNTKFTDKNSVYERSVRVYLQKDDAVDYYGEVILVEYLYCYNKEAPRFFSYSSLLKTEKSITKYQFVNAICTEYTPEEFKAAGLLR